MGHKTHPNGLRLGVIRGWESKWYAEDKFADLLYEDIVLRRYLMKRFEHASLSKVGIERTVKKVNVNLYTARPGIVIGKKGEELERLKGELQFLTGKEIYIAVHEIKRPETDAKLVAENIARQLEKRISFRRAMKRAIQSAMRMGWKVSRCSAVAASVVPKLPASKSMPKAACLCTLFVLTSTTQLPSLRPFMVPSVSRCGSCTVKRSVRTS